VSINTSLGRMRYALGNLRKMIDQYQLNLWGLSANRQLLCLRSIGPWADLRQMP
jgi:hypothetical protein